MIMRWKTERSMGPLHESSGLMMRLEGNSKNCKLLCYVN